MTHDPETRDSSLLEEVIKALQPIEELSFCAECLEINKDVIEKIQEGYKSLGLVEDKH